MRIGIVAGEPSGDLLGAELIIALKKLNPDLIVEGVAGPKMIEAGCKALWPMERLSFMGFIGPLKHLLDILHIRRQLKKHFLKNPPDVFIGIDSPDFNLSLELKLKTNGIKTVHYVSPSVWGWREGRIHKIKRAVDLMLVLFPFETDIYKRYQIPVKFVGHPLADKIPLEVDETKARKDLGLSMAGKVLGIFPGSRSMEIKNLGEPFIRTALWCLKQEPKLQIMTSMIDKKRQQQFERVLQRVAPSLPIKIFENKTHAVMAASDALLLASGTVTLEGLLFEKPMVVAYKMAKITFEIMKRIVKVKHFALPNLIAGRPLVPEFIQAEVSPEIMGPILLGYLNNPEKNSRLAAEFLAIHKQLQNNASEVAAKAILGARS